MVCVRRHADGSPSTLISGTPGAMVGQCPLAAYYRSILMCSVLCQFFLRELTRHVSTSNTKSKKRRDIEALVHNDNICHSFYLKINIYLI